MQKYLKAVHHHLQIEMKVNPQQLTDSWLDFIQTVPGSVVRTCYKKACMRMEEMVR
jgi:hypothetical protein